MLKTISGMFDSESVYEGAMFDVKEGENGKETREETKGKPGRVHRGM